MCFEQFFSELTSELDDLKKENIQAMKSFFDQLTPRLDTIRKYEVQLDKQLARKFNVFDYVATNEIGLSRVIFDLLNPKAKHGQSQSFLRAFLKNLPNHWRDCEIENVSPLVERLTRYGRIDISVEFREKKNNKTYCIAFENKPYAEDLDDQIRNYLEYLKKQKYENFILIYLSPNGQGPSKNSITLRELQAPELNDNFGIISYCRIQNFEDEFDSFRLRFSLADWFKECQRDCTVDKLRWFLQDAELFCENKFGEKPMTTDCEDAVVDFVLSNQQHFETALAVHNSWAAIENKVFTKFLEKLKVGIKDKFSTECEYEDMVINCKYDDSNRCNTAVWLYKNSWTQYSDFTPKLNEQNDSNKRSSIRLEADNKGANSWNIGVWSPPSVQLGEAEQEKRRRLDNLFRGIPKNRANLDRWPHWPYWVAVDNDKESWSGIIDKLNKELNGENDEIMNYFIDIFCEVANLAIPKLDDIS